ncbi:MAG: lysophospholipid acyltransferase family protein [Henriciella sp.]|nr:lysophospholipid acyltransferase family protein [Henriciella sp.]
MSAELPTDTYSRPKDIDNRSTRWQRFIWRLETLAWDLIYWAPIKALPPDKASDFVGWLFKKIGPLLSQHKTVTRNLALAFPEKSEAERHEIAMAAWENVGRTAGELPHLPKINPYSGDRVEVIGGEHLDAALAMDKGLVLISGHFANFEIMAAAICKRPAECVITYRALNNPHIDQRLSRLRQRYGGAIQAPKGIGTRRLMKALRSRQAVALLNDQKFNQGLPISFFGHPAMTAPGPSRLALKYGAPLLFVSTRRTGPARFAVTFHEPFFPSSTGDLDADVKASVESITAMIEAEVRANPGQWFWQHRRWPKEAWKAAGIT